MSAGSSELGDLFRIKPGDARVAGTKCRLKPLLDGGYSDADIEDAWNMQSPSYNFSAGGHRIFLEIVRRQIIAHKIPRER
jgi:hypothetical protein